MTDDASRCRWFRAAHDRPEPHGVGLIVIHNRARVIDDAYHILSRTVGRVLSVVGGAGPNGIVEWAGRHVANARPHFAHSEGMTGIARPGKIEVPDLMIGNDRF